jgi:SnoaL-like domain
MSIVSLTDSVAASDRQAIIDLTIAYTWALDTKDFAALRDIFLPSATADLRGVTCDGAEAIITRISGAMVRLDASQHLIGNHQVTIDGDRATCRCQLQSQHVRAGTVGGDNLVIGGVYEDRLIRTESGWRISHRVMRQTWIEGNPAVVARSAS